MPPSYGTPQPGDDAPLRAWRRRYAEETERGFSLRLPLALPLALARRLRAEAAAHGVPHSRYVADLRRVARGDLPGGPALATAPPPTVGAPAAPPPAAPPPASATPAVQGQVDLRALRIIQFHEGRDDPGQLDTADTATVLRLLRADLAWLEMGGGA